MLAQVKDRLQFALFCTVHKRSLRAQQKWQGKHLVRLLHHATYNVPLWRSLLSQHGVTVEMVRTVEDIQKLPVTSKETYLGRMAEEYTDSSRPAFSYWYVTSGTSGKPFTFLMGEHAREARYTDFASLRFLWWLGKPFSSLATTRFARIKIRAKSSAYRLFISVEEYLKNPQDVLQKIGDFKTELLGAYPSLFLDMARVVKNNPDLKPGTVRYALSYGENLTHAIRKEAEEVLGFELYDRYGLEEIGAVGVECKEHSGFHINTESVIVEILDAHDNRVTEGEGRIVVTDLFNYSMPFIRYESGDFGRITEEACACGLRSPRLWVTGRYSAYLEFPQRKIHHLEFDGAMDTFMNAVYQYQIAKRSDAEIVARIVPGSAYSADVAANILASLKALVGNAITISVECVPALPVTPRGKSRIVIDESV